MDATFKRIVAVAVALVAIAAGAAALVMAGGCSATSANPLADARNGALNMIIDVSGIKGRIESEARSKADEIATSFGVPQAVVDNMIDSLAFQEWKATSLPADAVENGTYDIEADSLSAAVTTYDDPSIVTVDAYGQAITIAVPESAQGYLSLLGYLGT